jgi:hypothetical protein
MIRREFRFRSRLLARTKRRKAGLIPNDTLPGIVQPDQSHHSGTSNDVVSNSLGQAPGRKPVVLASLNRQPFCKPSVQTIALISLNRQLLNTINLTHMKFRADFFPRSSRSPLI